MLKTSPHRNFEHLVSHLCTPPYDKTTGEKFIEEEQKGALWSNVHIYMIDARNCYVNPLFRFKFHDHLKACNYDHPLND